MRAAVLIATLLALGAPGARAQPLDPVVVELYTSQGCEECWRANAVLAELARRPDVVALTFPVDYWDYLGWKDTYAHPAFAWRQRAYKKAMRLRELHTPQMVVDGASHLSGFDRQRLAALIQAHRRPQEGAPLVQIAEDGRRVVVQTGDVPAGGKEVLLIRYDPRLTQVNVTAGENRGRLVPHRNVVREVIRLGPWTGRGRTYGLPAASRRGLRSVVLVQSLDTRRIIACSPAR